MRARFTTMDALRGVAALVVVLHHTAGSLGRYEPPFSYLAVDLFFVLSGFVLAYSWDDKLREGGTWRFIKQRVIRLYPLYALGLLVGAINLVLFPSLIGLDRAEGAMSLAFSAVGLPVPTHSRDLFPLNRSAWSLFFEFYIANLAFAVFWRQLHGQALAMVVAACGLAFIMADALFHGSNVGWTWQNIAGGFPRCGFSFFAGVAIWRYRFNRPSPFRIPSWVFLVAFLAIVVSPVHGHVGRLLELACVLVGFPAMTYFSSGATERNPKLGETLGDSSYAAYTLHGPLLVMVLGLVGRHDSLAVQLIFTAAIAVLALAAHHVFDEPARARLKRAFA